MKETEHAIGFPEQRAALEVEGKLLPVGCDVVLMSDRFYGSADLIMWCRNADWDWRLRLKGDPPVIDRDGGESTVANCFARGARSLVDIGLTGKRVRTNVGMVHKEGNPEPWFIAMSEMSTTAKTFDYGLGWGIEAMFSEPESEVCQRYQGRPSVNRFSMTLIMASLMKPTAIMARAS